MSISQFRMNGTMVGGSTLDQDRCFIGRSIAAVDIDGDGIDDLVMGSNCGFAVVFLRSDGTTRAAIPLDLSNAFDGRIPSGGSLTALRKALSSVTRLVFSFEGPSPAILIAEVHTIPSNSSSDVPNLVVGFSGWSNFVPSADPPFPWGSPIVAAASTSYPDRVLVGNVWSDNIVPQGGDVSLYRVTPRGGGTPVLTTELLAGNLTSSSEATIPGARFGTGLWNCGDLDGDGVEDVVVTSEWSSGHLLLLLMSSGGLAAKRVITVSNAHIAAVFPPPPSALNATIHMGVSVVCLDVDGDGRNEIIMGGLGYGSAEPFPPRGGLWVLGVGDLSRPGKNPLAWAQHFMGPGELDIPIVGEGEVFGRSLAVVRGLSRFVTTGLALAVGAYRCPCGGYQRGGVYLIELQMLPSNSSVKG